MLSSISTGVDFRGTRGALGAIESTDAFSIGFMESAVIHNWFFPVVEAGIGFADNTPEQGNFTYRTKPSFYAKVGMNYNFMYKSDPAYQVFAGFRVGFSSFKYDIENIKITNGYWDQTQSFSMTGLKASAVWNLTGSASAFPCLS